jgi:hypothetical protein
MGYLCVEQGLSKYRMGVGNEVLKLRWQLELLSVYLDKFKLRSGDTRGPLRT